MTRETSVQEWVRNWWSYDGLMVDVDPNRYWQWKRNWCKTKTWWGEESGRDEELDKLFGELVVNSAAYLLSQQREAEHDSYED